MEIFVFYGTADEEEASFRVTVHEEEDYPKEESHNGIHSVMVHGHGDDCNAIIKVEGTNADQCHRAWHEAKKIYRQNYLAIWG